MIAQKINLLSLGVFEDNEYLDKYITLINLNEHTAQQKGKTQKHHIIPRCYYKERGYSVDNSSKNCIYLSHFNHALAHYYICCCSLNGVFKYANELALRNCIGHSIFKIQPGYEEDKTFIESLENYSSIMEECNLRKRPSQLVKQISESLKKVKHTPEWNEKVRLANCGRHLGQDAIAKISASKRGKICINNDIQDKFVKESDLFFYLNSGWHRGSLRHPKNEHPWNKGLTKADFPDKIGKKWTNEQKQRRCGKGNPMYGKHKSAESISAGLKTRRENNNLNLSSKTKQQISKSLQGYIVVQNSDNVVRHIRPEQLDEFTALGYFRTKSYVKKNKI